VNASIFAAAKGTPDSRRAKLWVVGAVAAINGDSITIHGKNGISYLVNVTDTKIMKAGKIIKVADIQIGDNLFVRGAVSGSAVTAASVIDGSRPVNAYKNVLPKGNNAFGTVSMINGTSFDLRVKNKKAAKILTVNTDGNTIIKKDGQTAGLADLAAGQHVMVSGAKDNATDTIMATGVNIITKAIKVRSHRAVKK
jgi:hypothetical protein